MTSIGALSSLLSLKMTNQIFAARTSGSVRDYKGLVCIFLFGGNDSFNMLGPGQSGYADYLASRQNLAIPENEMIRAWDTYNRRDLHVHPSMQGVRDLFVQKDVNFLANVGTLVEPTTLREYQNRSKRLPTSLFSHNSQQRHWQTSIDGNTGWGGRMLDVLNDAANNNATAAVNLSPAGNNIFQDSGRSVPFSVAGGVDSLDLYNNNSDVRTAIDHNIEKVYGSVLQSHHEHVRKEALQQTALLEDIEANTIINTRFPDTDLGRQLLQTAKFIKAQGALGANRQTFFVSQGGYDTHGSVLVPQLSLLGTLNDALVAFNAAMKEIGKHDEVVTYTASDFGRSLTSNGGGSDHGWGGNQIVMGGPVVGRAVCGTYPNLALGSDTDTGRGRQLPTISVDELNASLAYWFGVRNDSEMELVVPNIRNFWARNSTQQPIPGMFA